MKNGGIVLYKDLDGRPRLGVRSLIAKLARALGWEIEDA